jgi:osmotically-inducible protein OsmY
MNNKKPDLDDAVLPEKKYYGYDGVEFERTGRISFLGKGPMGFNPDNRLWEEVCLNLTFNPLVDATEIEVQVKNGTVLLSGVVLNWEMKKMAERSLENIMGVVDIKNNLRIRSMAS